MTTDFHRKEQPTVPTGKEWVRRLSDWWQPAVGEPDVEPELTDCRPTAPIALAAKGDAFDFSVRPTFVWRARRMHRTRFEHLIDLYTPEVLDALRLRSERVARTFEPHRSQHLEQELNARLPAMDWTMGPAGERLTCRPEVFVLPDPRVRESMQPYWRRRIEMQADHDLAMRRAELTRERTRAWSKVMEDLEDDPRSRHAASLVEHDAFAEVFTAMTQGRKDELLRLIDLLEQAGRSYNGIGLYEYAEGLDAALTDYRKRAGEDKRA
ncbi:hypothetical protein ACFO1B_20950 [Dactylosporangium siamense]|uniref:Uncharacterized protein n=1 Tax=Dactylosporangium siamense TaxID=685454 RepID=A0A919UDM5_9ACTN|nr:hypothetical protein [Dactylosporangium siamense]GIG46798.1 hypothetical protein Dsi01nite_048390 [Dactylosporangium siamense]